MSWTQIGYTVLDTTASTVSIAVPTPYDFYRVSAYIANDSNAKSVYVRFNGDSGSNYTEQAIYADGSTLSASRPAAQGFLDPAQGGLLSASQQMGFSAIVAKPSSSVKAQVVAQAGFNTTPQQALTGTEWDNTSAEVTSVALVASTGNFAAGTSFLLEGLNA